MQPPGGWCVNNAGIIGGRVLIDTAATEARARLLRTAAESLDDPRPVRTIVNTHFHGDHTFGNGLMGDGVTIVAHELTRQDIAATGLGMTRLWPSVAWGRVAPAAPTVTFTDRLTLHQDGLAIELIHVGTAHTTGDVVAWLPDERILFAGDVVFSGGTPYVLMGSVQGSLRAIDRLRALDPRIVVCGHGPVTGPDVFDDGRGVPAVAVAAGRAADWHTARNRYGRAGRRSRRVRRRCARNERLLGNLHRAYAEHQGVRAGRTAGRAGRAPGHGRLPRPAAGQPGLNAAACSATQLPERACGPAEHVGDRGHDRRRVGGEVPVHRGDGTREPHVQVPRRSRRTYSLTPTCSTHSGRPVTSPMIATRSRTVRASGPERT